MAILSTLDPASFEALTTELILAGFEPVAGSDLRIWEGPIAEAFRVLSPTNVMRICFRDGWPFRHPRVIVHGLATEHVSEEDVVCLWAEDDNSREWLTFEGIVNRIAAWCTAAQEGFGNQDRALDAWLGFEEVSTTLAAFDPTELLSGALRDGVSGRIHGVRSKSGLLEIASGHGASNAVRGRWFSRAEFGSPPRNIEQLRDFLTSAQRRDLDACIRRVRRPTSDGAGLAMVLAGRHSKVDALVIELARGADGELKTKSLSPAPRDVETLLLRSGPDALRLSGKRIACFGAGAIGSHAALLLAESGSKHLRIVDTDRLRPGNVVRHILGSGHVGDMKNEGVAKHIQEHAPWTEVTCHDITFDHTVISSLLQETDIVLDTTGNASLLEVLSRVAKATGVCLVSAALYRGGALTRVCRQSVADTPIFERSPPSYWQIPAGRADQEESLEMGCSAAVINAPPASVQRAATLAVSVAVDWLLGTDVFGEETIEVFQPLADTPPFDRLGFVSPPA